MRPASPSKPVVEGLLGGDGNPSVDLEANDVSVMFADIAGAHSMPAPLAEHPAAALRAALAASRAIAELGPRLRAVGLPPLGARFGIHSGTAMVGTTGHGLRHTPRAQVGTAARLSYTVIGDVPNVASRLESLNRRYGTAVLASGEAVARAGPAFLARLLDTAAVRAHPGDVATGLLLARARAAARSPDAYEPVLSPEK
eukprot:tig00021037_g17442.t1